MPLDDRDWQAIYEAINRMSAPTEFVFGIVNRRDTKHKLVWIEEFGDTPIPLVGFGANISVYDTTPTGNIVDVDMDIDTENLPRVFQSDPIVPLIGDVVCVIRQFGRNRVPHCIGKALSTTNYDPEELTGV